MKKFCGEFKKFLLRGNVLDLAVAVIIGASFQAIVSSLVNDIISPILGLFGGVDFTGFVAKINGVEIKYGAFITAVIQFVILAFVIFLLIKLVNKVMNFAKQKEEKIITTKKCPYCCSEIDINAIKCPHCVSDLIMEEK